VTQPHCQDQFRCAAHERSFYIGLAHLFAAEMGNNSARNV
jgi:hypothetical protein